MKKLAVQNKPSCLIRFENYFVSEMDFQVRDARLFSVTGKKSKTLPISIEHHVIVEEDQKHATVILKCEIGTDIDEVFPFSLKVVLNGFFSYAATSKKCEATFDRMCNLNATAILYPYLRSVVTDITKAANVPPLVLPPVNINKLLGTE